MYKTKHRPTSPLPAHRLPTRGLACHCLAGATVSPPLKPQCLAETAYVATKKDKYRFQ